MDSINRPEKPASFVALGLVLGLAALLAGCASGPNAPPPEIVQRIQSASTAADHESLANYYLAEATSTRALAQTHRRMAKSYQGQGQWGKGGASMPSHCNAIVQLQESIATEYTAMAGEHQKLALQLKP